MFESILYLGGIIVFIFLLFYAGFKNTFGGIVCGLFFWFFTWLAFDWILVDNFDFFANLFDCKNEYQPIIGRTQVCDFKNIPMIVGMIVAILGPIALKHEDEEESESQEEAEK